MKPSKFDAVGDAYECQEKAAGASVSMWLSLERLRKADSWSYISSRKPRNWAFAINRHTQEAARMTVHECTSQVS